VSRDFGSAHPTRPLKYCTHKDNWAANYARFVHNTRYLGHLSKRPKSCSAKSCILKILQVKIWRWEIRVEESGKTSPFDRRRLIGALAGCYGFPKSGMK
jgi:hypothetical protein